MAPAVSRRLLFTGLGAAALGATAIAAVPALSAPSRPAPGAPSDLGEAPLLGAAGPEHLHVMTFNIRVDLSTHEAAATYELPRTSPGDADHWPQRRPLVTELLRREQPTVLGLQEARFPQLAAIEEALPGHRYVGYGRHGGSQDEFSALFYDHDRLELLAWDQFWLSDTPDLIGSSTWGNEISRLVVWAHLRDRGTGAELAVVNTHFDHRSKQARRRSAEALLDLAGEGQLEGLPLIVLGDFNSTAHDSAAYTSLVADGPLVDAWDSAQEQLTPAWGTFPDYEDPVPEGKRIDWVLATQDVAIRRAAINTWRDEGGSYPSDHVPVQALVSLP